jgi:hypothetical protein
VIYFIEAVSGSDCTSSNGNMSNELFVLLFTCYLTALSVSGLYGVDEMMINDYGAVAGLRTGSEGQGLGENLPQCHFFHHENSMA